MMTTPTQPVCWCPRGNPPGNGGIVPPWLREPIRIILPVLPEPPVADEPTLPVVPQPPCEGAR